MKAFVITSPAPPAVQDVDPPAAEAGEVVVNVPGTPTFARSVPRSGARNGRSGVLAGQVNLLSWSLHSLPDVAVGTMVEPGGSSGRSIDAANLRSGDRAEIGPLGRPNQSLVIAKVFGCDCVGRVRTPDVPWHGVIEAINALYLSARACCRSLVAHRGHHEAQRTSKGARRCVGPAIAGSEHKIHVDNSRYTTV